MERLFVYGSLRPGGPNEHILSEIGGDWEPAVIKGRLVEAGWGAEIGYPGLVIEEDGVEISGYVFVSAGLSDNWAHLDNFEGGEYERIVAPVTLEGGEQIEAHVYVLRAS